MGDHSVVLCCDRCRLGRNLEGLEVIRVMDQPIVGRVTERFLSQHVTCMNCNKPIIDESQGYTVRDEFENFIGTLCRPCATDELCDGVEEMERKG